MADSKRIGTLILDLPMILAGLGHIRILLREAGLTVEGGIVIVAPNIEEKERLIRSLESYGAIRGRLSRKKIPEAYNFQCVMLEYRMQYSQDVLVEFMTNDEYLPLLIVWGILPENLPEFKNIMFLENTDYTIVQSRVEFYTEFMEYTHQNPGRIIQNLRRYALVESEEGTMIQRGMVLTAMICQDLNFEANGDLFEKSEFEKLLSYIYKATDVVDDDREIIQVVERCLGKYIEEKADIFIGSSNPMDEGLYEAVKRQKAIFFDYDFYYIPDGVLRDATKKLQETLSYPSIKAMLTRAKVLCCDNVDNSYTVKKQLVTVQGKPIRQRFLKINRQKFDEAGELTIAERSGFKCTSVR